MNKPLYAELADTLRRQIGEGEFPVGSVLPSELTLSAQHGISRFTPPEHVHALVEAVHRHGRALREPR